MSTAGSWATVSVIDLASGLGTGGYGAANNNTGNPADGQAAGRDIARSLSS